MYSWIHISLVITFSASVLTGCITTERERKLRAELSALQLRVQDLEHGQHEGTVAIKSTDESANKRIASQSTDIERMTQEVQKLRGELDAVRVGVNQGEMPGQEVGKEGSVNTRLTELTQRIAAIESTQADIVATMEKISSGAKPDKKSKKDDKDKPSDDGDSKKEKVPLANAKELGDALAKNKYNAVIDDAPKVIKESKGKDKENALFAYAESLFKVGKLREAALQYNELIETNPTGRHVVQSKMRLGDAFRHLGDISTAKLYYEELVEKHSNSAEANKAKDRLADLAKGSGASGKKAKKKS